MADNIHLALTRTVDVVVSRAELLASLTDPEIRAEVTRRNISDLSEADALMLEHVRGARGLLDWTLHRLSACSGVSVFTIKRIEDGDVYQTRPSKLAAIRRAFELQGVRFITIDGGAGVVRSPISPSEQVAA